MVSNCSSTNPHHAALSNTAGSCVDKNNNDEQKLAEFAKHIHIAAGIASTTSSGFASAFGKEMQNAFSGTGITV
ncbi:MAG: hypothetical protein EXS67_04410 [Candidatus Margulisbacteria bacterium]|nr:hypothetical protein [Candidatus Margulisiibacteriota bacterium]